MNRHQPLINHDAGGGGDTDESDYDDRIVDDMRQEARLALDVLSDPERGVQVAFGKAAAIGDMQLAAIALDLGAGVDRTILNPLLLPGADYTAIYIAAFRGFHHFVEFLLEDHGANVNLGRERWTPLHAACFRGHAQCVTILLAHGADPNRINRHGQTPLFLALHEGCIDCLRALAEGARVPLNVNAVATGGRNAGMTALDVAMEETADASRYTQWYTPNQMLRREQCVTFLRNELGALRAQDLKQPKRPKNARKKG